jgi:release factor glutamine methyltransferase
MSVPRSKIVSDAPPTLSILDLGTGSGCIALALADELPNAHITATDISPKALEIARANADLLGLENRITFVESDGFDALGSQQFDIIVSNPPYIPSSDVLLLEEEVRDYEPTGALDGGIDGLDLFRRISSQAPDHLRDNGALFVELDEGNVAQGAHLAVQLERYSSVNVKCDLNGRERYVVATIGEKRGSPS